MSRVHPLASTIFDGSNPTSFPLSKSSEAVVSLESSALNAKLSTMSSQSFSSSSRRKTTNHISSLKRMHNDLPSIESNPAKQRNDHDQNESLYSNKTPPIMLDLNKHISPPHNCTILENSPMEEDSDALASPSASPNSTCLNQTRDACQCKISPEKEELLISDRVNSLSSRNNSESSSDAIQSDQSSNELDFIVPELSVTNAEGETEILTPAMRARKTWKKVLNAIRVQNICRSKFTTPVAGHQDAVYAGVDGVVLKKYSDNEFQCFVKLMADPLRGFVPGLIGVEKHENGKAIKMADLLAEFDSPKIMDCKIGIRTYLEEELSKARRKPELRPDMYKKMIAVDKNAPSEEEHLAQAITKPRYMVWREEQSSSQTLGFRIDGIKTEDKDESIRDFKKLRNEKDVKETLRNFISSRRIAGLYLGRLKLLLSTLHDSPFFKSHEMIGSSLLFLHDAKMAGIWLIDFAKSVPLPAGVSITHDKSWEEGNHEDGYLVGVHNLIRIIQEIYVDLG